MGDELVPECGCLGDEVMELGQVTRGGGAFLRSRLDMLKSLQVVVVVGDLVFGNGAVGVVLFAMVKEGNGLVDVRGPVITLKSRAQVFQRSCVL